MREELLEIIGGLKEHLRRNGGSSLGTWKSHAAPAAPSAPTPAPSQPRLSSTAATPVAPSAPTSQQRGAVPLQQEVGTGHPLPKGEGTAAEALEHLRINEIGDCQICPLGATRIKLAFGVGNPEAKVMIIGEGPGYMEDRQGEPFVGPAGQLLDKILAAIELSRQPQTPSWKWVYIANMVKCHPMVDPTDNTKRGNDRAPAPEEIEKCFPFLAKQIRIVKPKFIVAMGATAAKALLNTTKGVMSIRGQWFDFNLDGCEPMRLIPTYHPAALLRNPDWKKDVWEDVKKLRAELLSTVS